MGKSLKLDSANETYWDANSIVWKAGDGKYYPFGDYSTPILAGKCRLASLPVHSTVTSSSNSPVVDHITYPTPLKTGGLPFVSPGYDLYGAAVGREQVGVETDTWTKEGFDIKRNSSVAGGTTGDTNHANQYVYWLTFPFPPHSTVSLQNDANGNQWRLVDPKKGLFGYDKLTTTTPSQKLALSNDNDWDMSAFVNNNEQESGVNGGEKENPPAGTIYYPDMTENRTMDKTHLRIETGVVECTVTNAGKWIPNTTSTTANGTNEWKIHFSKPFKKKPVVFISQIADSTTTMKITGKTAGCYKCTFYAMTHNTGDFDKFDDFGYAWFDLAWNGDAASGYTKAKVRWIAIGEY